MRVLTRCAVLEGREFEETTTMNDAKYIGAKCLEWRSIPEESSAPAVRTWSTMVKLHQYKGDKFIRIQCCQELAIIAEESEEDVLFYLPQLCILLLNEYEHMIELKQFILGRCRVSIHFALQSYLLVRASKVKMLSAFAHADVCTGLTRSACEEKGNSAFDHQMEKAL